MAGRRRIVTLASGDGEVDAIRCAADGERQRDAPCTIDPTSGLADCVGGTLCYPTVDGAGSCSEICGWSPDSCSSGSCAKIGGVFEDHYFGVCVEATDAGA